MTGPAAAEHAAPRYMTPDGRTSMFNYLFNRRQGSGSIMGLWRRNMKPEVLPLVILMTGAIGMATGFATRHLFYNPDVQVNKLQRKQTVRENFDTGHKWVRHHNTMKNAGPQYIKPYSPKKDMTAQTETQAASATQ